MARGLKNTTAARIQHEMGDMHSEVLILQQPVGSLSRTHVCDLNTATKKQPTATLGQSVLPQTENIGCMYLAMAEYNCQAIYP